VRISVTSIHRYWRLGRAPQTFLARMKVIAQHAEADTTGQPPVSRRRPAPIKALLAVSGDAIESAVEGLPIAACGLAASHHIA